MPPKTIADDDKTLACPECDSSTDLCRRNDYYKRHDKRYSCHKCGATFDDPVERDKYEMPTDAEDEHGLPVGISPAAKEHLLRLKDGGD